jgi:hypothetical protein
MTLAERFRQQGHQLGRQQGLCLGRQLTLQEAVLNVLATRFSRIPEGRHDALLSLQDEATLQALHRAAVECPSLEAFAERL